MMLITVSSKFEVELWIKMKIMDFVLKTVGELATKNPLTVSPNQIMTDVSQIMESSAFHHFPVVENDGNCVGVISKSDLYQLQDCFTKSKTGNYQENNQLLFRSLLASDVMTSHVVFLDKNRSVLDAITIFLENKVHSVIILNEGQLCGIITPYDILLSIKNWANEPEAVYLP
jgi:acetoin utilization protein AcuB